MTKIIFNDSSLRVQRPILNNSFIFTLIMIFGLFGLIRAISNEYPVFYQLWIVPTIIILLFMVKENIILSNSNVSGTVNFSYEYSFFNETLFRVNHCELENPTIVCATTRKTTANKDLFNKNTIVNLQDGSYDIALGELNGNQFVKVQRFITQP